MRVCRRKKISWERNWNDAQGEIGRMQGTHRPFLTGPSPIALPLQRCKPH